MIAVTALTLDGVDRVALDAGYNDFLRKPIEQEDVSRIIEEYFHTDIATPVQ
jgi:CheY-like chemotaxis protein